MPGLGFGSFKGVEQRMTPRPEMKTGDTVRHTARRNSRWRGRIVRHDGRIAVKWDHLADPVPLADYPYNDIRKC